MRITRGAVLAGVLAAGALALSGCGPVAAVPVAAEPAAGQPTLPPGPDLTSGAASTSPLTTPEPTTANPATKPATKPATANSATKPATANSATKRPASATTPRRPAGAVARTPEAGRAPSSAAPAVPAPGPVPAAGNPRGTAIVPAAARAADTSRPTRVVGTGTPASCTSTAVVAAVAAGGVVTFDCGPDPVTITLTETAKVRNGNPRLVLDGGGRVTLSGGGARRVLYQNACDQGLGWTTTHCQDQETPSLVVQNLTFADGNSSGLGEGGGAIFVRGGQFRVVNSRFVRNRCARTGPDQGGAALRVFDLYQDRPAYVVGSTFGGASGQGGVCSNGGALSSIGVSWTILNSVFSHNTAVGSGANPARSGTPGGGSGGAIYLDGNEMALRLDGTVVQDNTAAEGGGAIFFVSNNRTGTLSINASTLRRNPSKGFETAGLPGIFFLGASAPAVAGSTLSK